MPTTVSEREERLEWLVADLRREIRRLEQENGDLRGRVEVAEHLVSNELEPRIKADERRYDAWATSPERG